MTEDSDNSVLSDIENEDSDYFTLEMHFDEDSTTAQFGDLPKLVDYWLQKFKEDPTTCSRFREYWRKSVPNFCNPDVSGGCLNIKYDEEAITKYLLKPLESFITLDSKHDSLQKNDIVSKSSKCGFVFKVGEPIYYCRDCAIDHTCVLCTNCFKHSIHRNHRYKMNTSSGGGYCDCGDYEAWKEGVSCDIHSENIDSCSNLPTDSQFSTDMHDRARLVISCVLKYCVDIFTRDTRIDLPPDLQPKDDEKLGSDKNDPNSGDKYVTVLYNDETHTYEQVIQLLTRTIQCSHKSAVEYATVTDREGRSIVKLATFKDCISTKKKLEKNTLPQGSKPLKIVVMAVYVLAHHTFGMRLLQWLKSLLGSSAMLGHIFREIIFRKVGKEPSLLETIMKADTLFWKSAKSLWHNIMISGILMDDNGKKEFSKVISKLYPVIFKDFIEDDVDYSMSVLNLTVQIYTTKSLAHMLIGEHDMLLVLFRTFLSECDRHTSEAGRLAFERSPSIAPFKRACNILSDIKYLLSVAPDHWTSELKSGFYFGFTKFTYLLSLMQEMDSVKRETEQHLEFDPEWETAFNTLVRLRPIIYSMIHWCSTNSNVLIKAYRGVLKKIEGFYSSIFKYGSSVSVANHSATPINYDVSSQPVSVHLPLSRLFAGLHLHLESHGLQFDSEEFLVLRKPSPAELMEPVLRVQVMMAQTHCNMWRRNGYSLLNQIYFYMNVRCRSEMYDRDVVLLQIGAALMESNEYLIHILNKFGLIRWCREDYDLSSKKAPDGEDDSLRVTTILAEEFLSLLITIIGERYTVGVGQVTPLDCLKHEIIQQLCVKSLSHSELNRVLPEDMNNETGLDAVVREVANFNKPEQGKGVYDLKPEMVVKYNPYHYHYTREEVSKSEENMKKKRQQLNMEIVCSPPDLIPLTKSFKNVGNLLQCDVMLYLMKIVLDRAADPFSRSFSELQFHRVLFLIGYALSEDLGHFELKDQSFQFLERADKWDILPKLEKVFNCNRKIEAHNDLLVWTIRRYKELKGKRKPNEDNSHGDIDTLTLSEARKAEKKRRNEIAEARKARIMAQMCAIQKNFLKEHANYLEDNDVECEMTGASMDLSECYKERSVAVGPKQTLTMRTEQTKYTCIHCQETQNITATGRALVLSAFVQKSTVLTQNRNTVKEDLQNYDTLYLPSDLSFSPVVSTCGHVMHADCWRKYIDNVIVRERRRLMRSRLQQTFDVDKHEFLCPLCECLSNTVLPLVPNFGSTNHKEPAEIAFDHCLNLFETLANSKVSKEPKPRAEGGSDVKTLSSDEQILFGTDLADKLVPEETSYLHGVTDGLSSFVLSDQFLEMVSVFSQSTFTVGLNANPHTEDPRLSLLAFRACAYTIMSIEFSLRDENKPLLLSLPSRQHDCLSSLVKSSSILAASLVDTEVIKSHCLRLLSLIFCPKEHCILDVDAFGLLVSLTFAIRAFTQYNGARHNLPTGSLVDLHVMLLCLIVHLVQILWSLEPDVSEPMDTEDNISAGPYADIIATLYSYVRPQTEFNPVILMKQIKRAAAPFLRASCLFWFNLSAVPASTDLQAQNGDTLENMLEFLGLNDVLSHIVSPVVEKLVKNWCASASNRSVPSLVQYPIRVNQLIELPTDYSDLIDRVSSYTCPNSDGDESRTPTMCLVCGAVLCAQSYCCQTEVDGMSVGACTSHAHYCGAGTGIFIRVRECKLLLLSSRTKGCFLPPPYLDDYGESDSGLLRGNPLHLSKTLYKELHRMWLTHGIPETISRKMENANISTEWNYL